MNKPTIAIITSTWNRDISIIERCVRTIQAQSYGIENILHFICSDGPEEIKITNFINIHKEEFINTFYCCSGENTNSWGAGPRQWVLDNILTEDSFGIHVKYVCFIDDDNIIFPDYIQSNIELLEENPDKVFSICNIIHCGPLPDHLGIPPKIITGIPPVYRNIDTLQVVCKLDEMKQCSWTSNSGISGYFNDGETYDRLGKMFSWIHNDKLLGIHI